MTPRGTTVPRSSTATTHGRSSTPTSIQLEVFGVRVRWVADDEHTHARLFRYLDDGAYLLELNDKIPASDVPNAIEFAWRALLDSPNANEWAIMPQRGDNPAFAWQVWGTADPREDL
jgi:hypothetical protein